MKNKPTVFISYNQNKSKLLVESLVKKLEVYADVQWDQNLRTWDSFTEFMKTISKQDFAVLVISNAYLKSVPCLYEVTQLIGTENWDKKTLFIVEEDAKNIYTIDGRIEYIKYWDDQEKSIRKKLPKGKTKKKELKSNLDLDRVREIKENFPCFLQKVADSNNPKIENAIEEVVNRISIAAKKNTTEDLRRVILYLIAQRQISASEIALATARSRSYINSLLTDMIKEQTIEKTGKGRSAVFYIREIKENQNECQEEKSKIENAESAGKNQFAKAKVDTRFVVLEWISNLGKTMGRYSLEMENVFCKRLSDRSIELYKKTSRDLSDICGDFNIEICQYVGLLDTENTFRDFEVEIRNSFYRYSTSIREILDKYYFRENTSNATGEINNVDQAFFESIKQFQKRIQDDIKS